MISRELPTIEVYVLDRRSGSIVQNDPIRRTLGLILYMLFGNEFGFEEFLEKI